MAGTRAPGMDHDYYEFSAIATRRPLRWPGGARLAFCVIVNLEYYELQPPEGAFTLARRYGPARVRPFPDITRASHREYGNRVGIFGIMKLLDRYGIRATAAMDATIAQGYPFLVKECQKRRWDIIGHGITANRLITSQMPEEEERAHIALCVRAIERATGQKPAGWLGIEYSESARTPHLLAEHGVRYVCDWPNDEQPYRMNVKTGAMYSLPVTTELDDHTNLGIRNVPIMDYARIARDTFDRLYREGARNGRLLVLNIHPWIMGQPYRLKYLDQILAHVSSRKRVWKATGAEIIDWYAQRHAS